MKKPKKKIPHMDNNPKMMTPEEKRKMAEMMKKYGGKSPK